MAENKKNLHSGYGVCRITNNDGIINIDFDPDGLDLDADAQEFQSNLKKNTESKPQFSYVSVLLFVADSYKRSCLLNLEQLNKINECTTTEQDIKYCKYYLPCMFSFRHSLELYLKAYYCAINDLPWENTHDLSELFEKVKSSVNNFDECKFKKDYAKVSFEGKMRQINEILSLLENKLNEYLKLEKTYEYFRYIFDRDYNMDDAKGNKEISINLKKVKTIINDIYNSLFKFQCEIIYFAFLLPLL